LFVAVDNDDDDEVVVLSVKEVVWSEEVVADDVVEIVVGGVVKVDIEEVVWINTENCAWLWPLLYPGLLAEAYTMYCPMGELVGRLNVSE
jgi:hypothetical protein